MKTVFAMAGNPNSGKTTLYNELTGARQHVGNYPGVTVEKKEGTYVNNGNKIKIVDLPGTYSLTAYSPEEIVARDYLVNEKPHVVINVVDASNLERNLYLTIQFLEMGIPVCIALNMMDVAKKRGIEINVDKLSDLLGVAVIPTVARSGTGKKKLMEASEITAGKTRAVLDFEISYGNDIDQTLNEMEGEIVASQLLTDIYPARWIALKYLERDEQIIKLGNDKNRKISDQLIEKVQKVEIHLRETVDSYPEAEIADHRYGYIRSIIKQGVVKQKPDMDRLFISDKIDRVVTHRFLGPIIMFAVIMGLYQFVFTASQMPVEWLEGLFGWLSSVASAGLPDGLLKSLVVSGVIDGVGGVLGFVPLIMFMFFGISILEDSGYLARVAFMLDRVFRMFGLHGSSVMAYVVSGGIAGGCAVPGVMASRTLKSPRERLATLLTVPFMNCGAKLPVFVLLVAAFFAENKAAVMLAITLISWTGALLVAKLLRSTVIKGEAMPFVLELPPYRFPTLKGLTIHTWERTWQYIKKAGTVILGISVILWAMMTFPGLSEDQVKTFEDRRSIAKTSVSHTVQQELETAEEGTEVTKEAQVLKGHLNAIDLDEAEAGLRNSLAGRIGIALESITKLAGFDWRTNIALVGGFAAKEVVVSTLGTAYSLGEVDPEEIEALSETIKKAPGWSPLVAWSLIIFTIFYAPCFVTIVCIAREAGSWKWGAFSMVFNTVLAFTMSVAVFQIGSLL